MNGLTFDLVSVVKVIETDEDIRKLRDMLDIYLMSKGHRSITAQAALKITAEKPKEKYMWIVDALKALGGQGTADQIYDKMVEMGYTGTAKNPKESVKTMMSHYKSIFEHAGFVEGSNVRAWRLIDAAELSSAA